MFLKWEDFAMRLIRKSNVSLNLRVTWAVRIQHSMVPLHGSPSPWRRHMEEAMWSTAYDDVERRRLVESWLEE